MGMDLLALLLSPQKIVLGDFIISAGQLISRIIVVQRGGYLKGNHRQVQVNYDLDLHVY